MKDLGQKLQTEREKAGFSLGQIAAETKIPKRSLLLLEEGAFSQLPGEVFVKGFIKSYARTIGVEEKLFLDDYAQGQSEAQIVETVASSQQEDDAFSSEEPATTLAWTESTQTGERSGLTLAVVIVLIAATLTMSYLLRDKRGDASDGVTWYTPIH